MAEKKKHHYTPNFILRGFATATGKLWVLDKKTGRCWAKDGGTDGRFDAFAENNYNSLLGSIGKRDTRSKTTSKRSRITRRPSFETWWDTRRPASIPP